MASGIVSFFGAEIFGEDPPSPRSRTMFMGTEVLGHIPPSPRSRTMFMGIEVLGGGESAPDPPSAAGLVKTGDATVIAVYVGDQPLQSIHAGDVEIEI